MHEATQGVGLHVVSLAALPGKIHDGVGGKISGKLADGRIAPRIWRHDGAGDVERARGQHVERVARCLGIVAHLLVAGTVVDADDAGPAVLQKLDDLVGAHARRDARKHDAGCGCRRGLSALAPECVCQGVELLDALFVVGHEGCAEGNLHELHARQRRRLAPAQIEHPLERLAEAVRKGDGVPEP